MKTRKISTIEDLATLIQGEFLVLGGKIEKLERRMDSIEKRMANLEKEQAEVKNELRDIKFELKRKVTRDELEELEKRVIGLEKLSFAR